MEGGEIFRYGVDHAKPILPVVDLEPLKEVRREFGFM